MSLVLHREIAPWQRALAGAALPRMIAVEEADWLRQDEVFAEQLALKAALIAAEPGKVMAVLPGAEAALDQVLDMVLDWQVQVAGARLERQSLVRADGVRVPVDRAKVCLTLSRLVQEDLCLLDKRGDEHVLTAAVLGFPAGWTLAEKLGHPMMRIHRPVAPYDEGIGARVQRMFDNLPEGRILGRANLHREPEGHLWRAQSEADPKPDRSRAAFERSEWQTIRRVPRTDAILFTIHTSVVRLSGDPAKL